MIEYRYFHRLTRENKKKVLASLGIWLEYYLDENEQYELLQDMHMEICETLRNQTRSKVDRYKKS